MELDGDRYGWRECDVRGCCATFQEDEDRADSVDYDVGDLMDDLPSDISKDCSGPLVDLCEEHATGLAKLVSDFFDGLQVLAVDAVKTALAVPYNEAYARELELTDRGPANIHHDADLQYHRNRMCLIIAVCDKLGINLRMHLVDKDHPAAKTYFDRDPMPISWVEDVLNGLAREIMHQPVAELETGHLVGAIWALKKVGAKLGIKVKEVDSE